MPPRRYGSTDAPAERDWSKSDVSLDFLSPAHGARLQSTSNVRDTSWKSSAIKLALGVLVLGALTVSVKPPVWIFDGAHEGHMSMQESVPDRGASSPLGLLPMKVAIYHEHTTEDKLELYPWAHVAEPHKTMFMEVIDFPEDALGDDPLIRWEIDGEFAGTGMSLSTSFTSTGRVQCSVSAFETGTGSEAQGRQGREEGSQFRVQDDPTARHSFEVTVKYVRREIRSLTDRDREAFFNAVSVLQRVPSAVGREIYGQKYHSKDYFNRLHLYYGGQKDCDHWHDGAGFVTSHIAVSLMFEQALQAVNPSVALPYWDFTIEGSHYDWTNFRNSSVFADDWFGSAAPRNDMRTPDRGRFAYVPTMTNAAEYSKVYNAFGLLRSPWNTDPSPFLTRHDHIFGYVNNRKPAGCRQYRDALLQSSWMALTESMNLGAHGHIHELLGGTWSEDWSHFDEETTQRVFPFMHDIVPFMKYIWRSGHIVCPQYCATDASWAECQCVCPDSSEKPSSQILEESGLLSPDAGAFFYDKDMKLIDSLGDDEGLAYEAIPGYTAEETRDIYDDLLKVLCTPMKIGTHYEGTSTNDVTFWVLHPTFDRLWHLRRLQADPHFIETWIDDHTCYGHNPLDIQPFHDLFGTNELAARDPTGRGVRAPKSYYTNGQLYDLLRPDGQAIPYVYDSFEWEHCDALGISVRGQEPDDFTRI